jgi:hypothetical protein
MRKIRGSGFCCDKQCRAQPIKRMADAVERARTSEPFGMRQRRRRQAQITHARVEPGQIATRLPRRPAMFRMSDPARLTTPMPRLQKAPATTTGSPAAAPRMAAAMPKPPKSTLRVTTAFLPSVGLSKVVISSRRLDGMKRS